MQVRRTYLRSSTGAGDRFREPEPVQLFRQLTSIAHGTPFNIKLFNHTLLRDADYEILPIFLEGGVQLVLGSASHDILF